MGFLTPQRPRSSAQKKVRKAIHRLADPALKDGRALASQLLQRRSEIAQAHQPEAERERRALGDGKGMVIHDGADVFQWSAGRLRELPFEESWILVIDHKSRIAHAKRIGRGSLAGTKMDPEAALRAALGHRAAGIILVHNHPSGETKAGDHDIESSRDLQKLAEEHSARLLDSVIVTRTGWLSMLDEGLLSETHSEKPRAWHRH